MVALASPWVVSLFSMLLFHNAGAQGADTEGALAKNTAMYILIAIAALYFALTALCLLLVVCVCYCNHSFKKKSEAAPEKTEQIPLTPIKEEDESKDQKSFGYSPLPTASENPETPMKETTKKTDESKDLNPFGYSPLPTAPKKPEKEPLTPVKETRKKTDESKDLNPFGYSPLPTALEKPEKAPLTPVKETKKKTDESKELDPLGYFPLPTAKLALSGLAKPHRVESQPPVGHFTTPPAHVPAAVHKLPSARKGRRHQEKRKPPAVTWDHIGAGVMNPGYVEEFPTVTLMKNELGAVAHKWFAIGRKLNIPVAILNSIKRLNTADDDLCLMNMCEQWLRIESNPSWTTIVAVLESTVVDERALAHTIMEKYPCNDANYSPVVAPKNQPEANSLTWI